MKGRSSNALFEGYCMALCFVEGVWRHAPGEGVWHAEERATMNVLDQTAERCCVSWEQQSV